MTKAKKYATTDTVKTTNDNGITIDFDSDIWLSEHNSITIDLNNTLDDMCDDVFSDIYSACFPNEPIAIVCDLKNKGYKNKEIVSIFETFLSKDVNYHIQESILNCFFNPSDAAKEKSSDIKNHFRSKFALSALKSNDGDISSTRKQILKIIQNDYGWSANTKPISIPLLVTIPGFYDEDLQLAKLQNIGNHQKSDYTEYYKDDYPIVKTLYPALSTYRSGFGEFGNSYSGHSYFWVDSDNLIYRIHSSKSNKLRPFLEYFFSKEKGDFVIHKQKIDKIPSFDLFFYDIKDFRPAEIIYQ